MVRQVPILGVLMIVNGVLIAIMGALLIVLVPLLFFTDQANKRANHAEQQTQLMIASGIFACWGILVLVIALLNVMAGLKCMRYRSRVFVLVAVFCNIFLIPSYCALTSIGMLVYGLIVLFNGDVARAFEMGARGDAPDQIQRAFAPAPHFSGPDRPWGGDYERWR